MKVIRIRGASEHNLKHVTLDLPRDRLTVLTGISGSGKSSLAFDTLYKEGRRRFLESLPSYARRFLGGFDKPQVESVEGLSPAISIDQRTVGSSPRSTVGTATEIYDYLRLLFARLGEPHCPQCGRRIDAQSAENVVDVLLRRHGGERATFCAPVIWERKGEHRREIEALQRDGFVRLRIDGRFVRADDSDLHLDRRRMHTVEAVCDRVDVRHDNRSRLMEAVESCFRLAHGLAHVVLEPAEEPGAAGSATPAANQASRTTEHLFSSRFACPECGVDLPELEPRLFSFNSPYGACTVCTGLGVAAQIAPDLLVADPSRSLGKGGLAVFDSRGRSRVPELDLAFLAKLGEHHGFTLASSWGDLDEDARGALLFGRDGKDGLIARLDGLTGDDVDTLLAEVRRELPCRACGGTRLAPLARAVRFRDRSLPDLCALPIAMLSEWINALEHRPDEAPVAAPILREVHLRLAYLAAVGLSYLSLSRGSHTLAGGEAQRIRLARQVGSGLEGVLMVLDEPSIGLHPRDHGRLLAVLKRLRELGNTVVVVEHDLETILAADHLVDVGPGAGVLGGEIVAQGLRQDLEAEPRSVTGAYLSGRLSIPVPARRRPPGSEWLELCGVAQNNIRDLDVRVPLGLFVAVTGVSGSGKSTLIHHVLRPALIARLHHRSNCGVLGLRSLLGYQYLDKLIDIDQRPIGKSPRSNPATYTKVFDQVRDLYAALPEARVRGYGAGRFSFNVDGGRCLECSGAGVKVVDMQFLAPVEVTCDICEGRRYNRETLEVLLRGKNIRDVLDLTVAEAVEFFRDHPRISRDLAVLERVGLGYLPLGQPATTLSGGEAQRLKLAGELRRRETGRTLYILDEPTTGLHFDDVRRLVETLQELVSRGNSVIVIEHNLDLIASADHVIDLGPEGGDDGGRLVAEGTPEAVAGTVGSHTGSALRERLAHGVSTTSRSDAPWAIETGSDRDHTRIVIEGASLHNLRDVSVEIPKGKLTVITGVSGSGKTSLAFDTLFAEGQRRYIDSLSTYARQFLGRTERPAVRRISGLAPAIAIDQKTASAGQRSTVATVTEILDYLRLLYAHVGTPHCPVCSVPLASSSPSRLAQAVVEEHSGSKVEVLAPVSLASLKGPAVEEQLAQLLKSGFTRLAIGDEELRLDGDPSVLVRQVLDASRQRDEGGDGPRRAYVIVDRLSARLDAQSRLAGSLEQAFACGGGAASVKIDGGPPQVHTRKPSCPDGHFSFPGVLVPRMFSFNSAEGACATCRGTGVERRADPALVFPLPARPVLQAIDPDLLRFFEKYRASTLQLLTAFLRARRISISTPLLEVAAEDRAAMLDGGADPVAVELAAGRFETRWQGVLPLLEAWAEQNDPVFHSHHIGRFFTPRTCGTCRGHRLRPEALAVRVGGLSLHELLKLSIAAARQFFAGLVLGRVEAQIAADVLREIASRLDFLADVGLGYLTLDRGAGTLSGGEAQRIRLASQLGNRLVGVLYVLDEPTVGLHPRDTERLLRSLFELRDQGNTLVVVEHDRETIEAADWVVDMGPGAGVNGGRVVACGPPAALRAQPESLTGRYLDGVARINVHSSTRAPDGGWIELRGVRCHNLRGIDVSFPLGLITAVTGVSGSGKSSLVMDVLAEVLLAHSKGNPPPPGLVDSVRGLDVFRRTVVVDQHAIGRTPRSTPATYTGVWDHVRELFASLPLAKARGYGPGRFSFNSAEGACAACGGQGSQLVEMHFLADVWVSCDECGGRRFNEATLDVRFKGKNIAEVLGLTVREAVELFENQPRAADVLRTLDGVGLDYVALGQSVATLSGGESQRLKLAAELVERRGGGSVYILDEPTTGLHFDDVSRLLAVLERLVAARNTVIVIEHNLDLIAAADWMIDLGPEAADMGGRVVAAGTPQAIAGCAESHTGRCLERLFAAGKRQRREPLSSV